jgi:ParB family chromosome partitioning protein
MSVREVEALIKKLDSDKKQQTKKSGDGVDYLLEAQNRLTTTMGRRVTIKQGRGKGKIEIQYYSQDDFDVLFDALSSLAAGKKPGGNY